MLRNPRIDELANLLADLILELALRHLFTQSQSGSPPLVPLNSLGHPSHPSMWMAPPLPGSGDRNERE